MYNVDVHPDVYAEMEHSRAWYEERAEALGTEFLVEVDRAIEKVRESPMIWPFGDEDRGIRRYLVHRFPYGVVSRVSKRQDFGLNRPNTSMRIQAWIIEGTPISFADLVYLN
jgi:hypothetical protein